MVNAGVGGSAGERDLEKTVERARPWEMLVRRATGQVVDASKRSSRWWEVDGCVWEAITKGRVLVLRAWRESWRKRETESRPEGRGERWCAM